MHIRLRSAAGMALGALTAWAIGAASSAPAQPLSYTPPSCPPVDYHSAPALRPAAVCMNLGVTTHGTPPRDYLFLTPGGNYGTGAGIFQTNGTLVWWQRARSRMESDISVVHYHGHAYLAVWSGKASFDDPYGMGTVSLYGQHYQLAGRITSGAPFGPDRIDGHEFQLTPQGDALFGIYDPVSAPYQGRRVEVYQYVVQKVSLVRGAHGIHTGRVLFQWESLKHVPLSQSYVRAPSNHTVWDYFHGNAIGQDGRGKLIISSRNTWGIYEVSTKTGRTIWQVGAKGDHVLPSPWSWQHDVVPLGQHRYSLFDDGADAPGCTSGSQHASRALVVQVLPSRHGAGVKLLQAYDHTPAICSGFCGSVQLIHGGDVLINWGQVPEITEDRQTGGNPLMDLSLSNWSCRGYLSPWTGEPLAKPAVAAYSHATHTDVWASWNGSTQTTAWQVLAGRSASRLAPVESPTAKRGFETEIVLNHPYASVAVEALGSDGHVLSTSRAVPPRQ